VQEPDTKSHTVKEGFVWESGLCCICNGWAKLFAGCRILADKCKILPAYAGVENIWILERLASTVILGLQCYRRWVQPLCIWIGEILSNAEKQVSCRSSLSSRAHFRYQGLQNFTIITKEQVCSKKCSFLTISKATTPVQQCKRHGLVQTVYDGIASLAISEYSPR
jgi:hypothetical protein